MLHKRRAQVYAVLTGSSPDALAALLASTGAPMYHFAQVLNFPPLGDEFLLALQAQYARVHKGRKPPLEGLHALFERLGHKPALLRDVVKRMSAEGLDAEQGFARYLADEQHAAGWRALIDTLQPLERGIASVVALGLPPLGQETRELLGGAPQGRGQRAHGGQGARGAGAPAQARSADAQRHAAGRGPSSWRPGWRGARRYDARVTPR